MEPMRVVRTRDPGSGRTVLGFLGFAFLAGAGLALGTASFWGMAAPEEVQATPPPPGGPGDLDGDGLRDGLERFLGTDLADPDTDDDGYSDLEEFVRRTDPQNQLSNPGSSPTPNAGPAFRAVIYDAGVVHRVAAFVYLPDGNLGSVAFIHFGLYAPGGTPSTPPLAVNVLPFVPADPHGLQIFPASGGPQALIVELSVGDPFGVIEDYAPVSSWGIVRVGNQLLKDTVYYVVDDGVLGQWDFLTSQVSGGAAFRPLDPSSQPPGWTAYGQACVLTLDEQGTSGPVIVAEVTAAACQTFPSYCPPTCPSNLNAVHYILNPLALIGYW